MTGDDQGLDPRETLLLILVEEHVKRRGQIPFKENKAILRSRSSGLMQDAVLLQYTCIDAYNDMSYHS